jgi:DNA-binding SARP family transcriptional activator
MRQKTVFAVLALAAGRPVSCSELIAALWSDRPPVHTANLVQTYVMRLRQVLDPGRAHRQPSTVIPRAGDGYALHISAEYVDTLRFGQLVAAARAARRDHDHPRVTQLAEDALKVFDTAPLADIPLLGDHPRVVSLTNERCSIAAWLAESALHQGRPGDALTAIEEAAAARPLDETIHAWLIRLYHATGRQADALATYERIRHRLADELGIDPTPQLQATHRTVLSNDPTLSPVELTGTAESSPQPAPGATAPATRASPRGLPRDLTDFTGRDHALNRLLDAIPILGQPAAAPFVLTIDGMPGVGKTTLAIRLAHLVADRCPDAHLYLDLLGHSAHSPLDTAAALDALLRQLGVPGDRIPDQVDDRITRWRTELAARRTLLLLDNAATSDQIVPLLPAEPGCITLITSRRRLVGLDGALPFSLDVFTTAEALALQQRIAGSRVQAEPHAAEDVVRRCGHLPLAIRLAAARLAHRPGWSVLDLAQRLRNPQTPLRALAIQGRTIEAAFALSYDQLTPDAQLLFRRLGLHPGPDLTESAAAALADLDLDHADEVLTELVDAHLVQERVAGRYQLHDLLREYAHQLVAADPPTDRHTATSRLLDFYLYTSAIAAGFLDPHHTLPFDYDLGPAPRQTQPPADQAAATAWFATERVNLLAAIQLAADQGHHWHTWRLTRAAWRDLYYHGYDDDCLHTHRLAIEAAERAGEPHGVAVSHNDVAAMHYRRGRWNQALHHLDQAITIRVELGDRAPLATSLTNKANVLQRSGRYQEAIHTHQEALTLKLALPEFDKRLLFGTYTDLGQTYVFAGDHAAAEKIYRQHQELTDQLDSDQQRTVGTFHLGELRLQQGRTAEAMELLSAALRNDTHTAATDPYLQAETVRLLGTAHRGLGQLQDALRCHQQAVTMMQDNATLFGECDARIELAATLHALADTPGSLDQYRTAFDIATRLNLARQIAQAADGIHALVGIE